jgi:hypothetical protein
MKKYKYLILGILASTFISCDLESELEIVNDQDPSSTQIAVEATASKLFQGWYQAVNSYDGPGMSLAVMSDQMTCPWGNAGMRDTSSEPRIAWDNQSTYGSSFITEDYFNAMYSILSDSNNLVLNIQDGVIFSDNHMIESLARFGQAATLGSLALVFDKIYISDESGTLNEGLAVTYNEAITLALQKLDLAIDAANRGSFTLTDEINGTPLTSAQWSQFLNSYGARILANSARNSTERAAVDWSKVLAYTNNGLDFDLSVLADGYTSWYSEWMIYMIYPGWARTDMRTVNLMDPTYPNYWPQDGTTVLPEATPTDARLLTDYEYLSAQDYPPNRGTYHFSSYRHSRYDSYTNTGWVDFQPEYLASENDMYKAEAMMRTSNLSGAASIINAGTRVTRGDLPLVGETMQEISDAIHHERIVELGQTGMGLSFFEMRGKNLLQPGTFLHFPVPGAALDANKETNYTFGGTTGVAGKDYSNGGWR